MKTWVTWLPSVVLALGALFTVGIDTQQRVALRLPLEAAIPAEHEGRVGRDVTISEAELRVAGVTNYLMRSYESIDGAGQAELFSVYVGYYDAQTRGKSIHSPKNCLPGAGWEALASSEVLIPTAQGAMPVNRYLLQNGDQLALVLYWYQGRGRVRANEYHVKWDLLRDAALHGRTEEALVRVVVHITGTEAESFTLAAGVAASIAPAVDAALPSWNES